MKHLLSLSVNGCAVPAEVEDRISLADLVREHLRLTGTKVSCEQGACGSCTVLLNGVPVRSCIVLAGSCDGAEVTTIEGLDDDGLASELRRAFNQEHALQCGFCTPGMLITACDIVRRLPNADEAAIRLELSGNLCRCTGYSGIVRAVMQVLATRRQTASPRDRDDVG